MVVADWLDASQGELLDKPRYVQIAERAIEREAEIANQHFIDWTPDELQRFGEVLGQQRLELEAEDKHKNVRIAVARYLRDVVMPFAPDDPKWERMASALLNARLTGTYMYSREKGKLRVISDDKAGLTLLCPDDARDAGNRLQRRYLPTLLDWRNNGKALHKAVFTLPNFPVGQLRDGMKQIFKRFRKFIRSKKWPQIQGALCTLEGPLSARGDWNVHLNVLMMVDGFLDYGELRRAWHWDVEIDRLKGDRQQIEAALRELIKYPVKAVSEKSLAKIEKAARAARDISADHAGTAEGHGRLHARQDCRDRSAPEGSGSGPERSVRTERSTGLERQIAPALTDYPPAQFVELWDAYQGFRRTRTYGLLFGIEEPPADDMDESFEAVGKYWEQGGRRQRHFPLLDLIPGDKSTRESFHKSVIEAFRKLYGPPDLVDRVRAACKVVAQHFGRVSLAQN